MKDTEPASSAAVHEFGNGRSRSLLRLHKGGANRASPMVDGPQHGAQSRFPVRWRAEDQEHVRSRGQLLMCLA